MKSLIDMVQSLIDQGLTQTSIAAESGVTQPTISRLLDGNGVSYENGKKIEEMYLRHAAAPLPADSSLIPGEPIDGKKVREAKNGTRHVITDTRKLRE